MDVNLIRGAELSPAHRRRWSELQSADPGLDSPLFSAEFTAMVAAVRDDVFVGVLSEGDQLIGFFPFQSDGCGCGEPLARGASDFHGVVAAPGMHWEAQELLRGCGLQSWSFDHLIADQEVFRPYHQGVFASPTIDLAGGFDDYARRRRAAGSRQIPQVEASRRRLERDHGALRFVLHDASPHALARLREWKSAQYRRLGTYDRFGVPWLAALLEAIRRTQGPDMSGLLSTLSAGDNLIAAHLGMRSRHAWHYWFPAFDPRFARYQPGLILLLEMARHAGPLGLTRIDLGKGPELYKQRLASGSTWVAYGRAESLHVGRAFQPDSLFT
jgi:CelD/BcsL family acetyltransferase involved in cellulose biosynthesis